MGPAAPAAGCFPLSNQPVLSCSEFSSSENLSHPIPTLYSFATFRASPNLHHFVEARHLPVDFHLALLHGHRVVTSRSGFTPLRLQFSSFLFFVTLNLSRHLEHPFLLQPQLSGALRPSKALPLPSRLTPSSPSPSPTKQELPGNCQRLQTRNTLEKYVS